MTTIQAIKKFKRTSKVEEANHARSKREEVYQRNQIIIDQLIEELYEYPTASQLDDLNQVLCCLFPKNKKTNRPIPSKYVVSFIENLIKYSPKAVKEAIEDFKWFGLDYLRKERRRPPIKLFYGYLKQSDKNLLARASSPEIIDYGL